MTSPNTHKIIFHEMYLLLITDIDLVSANLPQDSCELRAGTELSGLRQSFMTPALCFRV